MTCDWAGGDLGWPGLPQLLLQPLPQVPLRYHRFAQYMSRCLTHWHFYRFTRDAIAGRLRTYNSG